MKIYIYISTDGHTDLRNNLEKGTYDNCLKYGRLGWSEMDVV